MYLHTSKFCLWHRLLVDAATALLDAVEDQRLVGVDRSPLRVFALQQLWVREHDPDPIGFPFKKSVFKTESTILFWHNFSSFLSITRASLTSKILFRSKPLTFLYKHNRQNILLPRYLKISKLKFILCKIAYVWTELKDLKLCWPEWHHLTVIRLANWLDSNIYQASLPQCQMVSLALEPSGMLKSLQVSIRSGPKTSVWPGKKSLTNGLCKLCTFLLFVYFVNEEWA